MKLKKMVLKGYKRLITAGIEHFEFTPESDQIIIIGSNGSGKSSIVSAMTPLPLSAGDFVKDGFHQTEWEHRGDTYVLTSDFSQNKPHSFKKNDEELNQGGTGKIQSVLVKDNFNIDAVIQNIMMGVGPQSIFTSMAPIQRRDCIMRISGGDFSYVMQLSDKINGRLRDTLGAIKHNRNRLVELEKDRVTQDEIDSYQKQLNDINLEFSRLNEMEKKLSGLGDTSYHHIDLDGLFNEEKQIALEIDKLYYNLNDALSFLSEYNVDINNYQNEAQSLQRELDARKQVIHQMLETLNHINSQQHMVKEAGSLEELKKESDELNRDIEILLPSIAEDILSIHDPKNAHRAWSEVGQSLNGIFARWDYEKANTYTEQLVNELKHQRSELENYCSKTEFSIKELQHKLIHLRGTDDTECPRCGHLWKPGSGELTEEQLEAAISARNEKLAIAKERVVDKQNKIADVEDFLYLKQSYLQLCRGYQSLDSLWLRLNESRVMYDPSKNMKLIVSDWESNLVKAIELKEKKQRLDQIQEKLEFLIKINESNVSLDEKRALIEEKINSEYSVRDEIVHRLEQQKQIQQNIDKVNSTVDKVKQKIDQLTNMLTSALNNEGVSSFKQVNQELNNDAFHINSLLIRTRNAKSVIDELETSLKTLTDQHKLLMILSSELSPKEGLVAELLIAFISRMLEDMNTIIRAVWSYDLEILPCSKEDGELSFKFPIYVKGSDQKPADISLGSSSQTDIIDFVFKLIVMKYLGLSDYPIVLDEPFTTLDEAHRRSIVHYVRQLVDTEMCSQMIMISHYAETHTSFPAAEYVVTDPSNITVPSKYNKNVVMR